MPIYMIERRYAEEFFPDAAGAAEVRLIVEVACRVHPDGSLHPVAG